MKKQIFKVIKLLLVLFIILPNSAFGTTVLPSFLVLQQQSSVPFWGESNEKSVTISTSWDKKTYKTKVANGKWNVVFKTPRFGGPHIITLDDGVIKKLSNILIGEVWLCSGQSNMAMQLEGWGKVNNYKEEIEKADYPQIRLLQVECTDSTLPLNTFLVAINNSTFKNH